MDPKPSPKPEPTLQDRIHAVISPAPAKLTDVYTAKLICHRSLTLAPIGKPDGIDPNRVRVDFIPGSVKCIGKICALWNDLDLECYDVTSHRARRSMAMTLENMDGHARMTQGGK